MAKNTPPKVDELEISLFGAGIGECVVVHLGSGIWMVVDSCLNESRENPIALDYLESLGVNVSQQVRLVVVTHWHDDHIRGISKILEVSSSARFTCSAAMLHEEFFALVCSHEHIKLVEHTSGILEFSSVLDVLQARAKGTYAIGPDLWAREGMLLYQETNPYDVSVWALSPSDQTITDSKGDIARLVPSLGDTIRRFPTLGPNNLSVVLLVRTAGLHALLGGDLETGIDERRGWQAVLASPSRPLVLSSAYKVAHHGSDGADLDTIWEGLLTRGPHAILTPYARGIKPLPSEEDVRRLKSKTQHVYCTAWPPTEPPPRRHVDRTMNEIARRRQAIRKTPGHIRLRAPMDSSRGGLAVELFARAKRL